MLLFPGLKAQDVKFDITLKGATLNYTVVNDTPNDIYLVQYGNFNPDRGSHCYVYYKDTDGYVGEVSFVLIEKMGFLISPVLVSAVTLIFRNLTGNAL